MIQQSIYFERLGFAVEYLIGQNAKDNFDILDMAAENDWWFHVYDKPSCHVIARLPGKLDRHDLRYVQKQGAVLCRKHSGFHDEKIMCARVQYVKKTDVLGQVTVDKYRII